MIGRLASSQRFRTFRQVMQTMAVLAWVAGFFLALLGMGLQHSGAAGLDVGKVVTGLFLMIISVDTQQSLAAGAVEERLRRLEAEVGARQ